MYAEDLVTCKGDWEILVPYQGDLCPYTYMHLLAGEQYFSKVFTLHTFMSGGGGGTWVFFGWVCAAWDSKLAPGSKKISSKIDIPF